jgi:hypothetical protein
MLTVIVVAACQAALTAQTGDVQWVHMRDPTSALDAFLVIACAGMIPGMMFGAFLGWIAPTVEGSPLVRFVMLALLSIGAITSLGCTVNWHSLITPACVPALAACFHLERRTRPPAPMPIAVLQ